MPLGDSLTEGYFLPNLGGYRIYLDPLLRHAQFEHDFVGSMSTGPSTLEDKDNEGHQGQNIDYFTSNFATWYATNPCSMVLVHVGSAQVANQYQISSMGTMLTALLDAIYAQNSRMRVVLAQIPEFTSGYAAFNADVIAFNALIPAIASAQSLKGRAISTVNMYGIGVTTSDGVHPTAAGYELMAQTWLPGIYTVLGASGTSTVANTTLNAVIESMIASIEGLTPGIRSEPLFRRSPKDRRLREWAGKQNNSSTTMRKFAIVRTGSAEDPGWFDPTEVMRNEEVTITVAYPRRLTGIYRQGSTPDDEVDLDDVIRRDAKDIRDAVFSSDNYLPGHHLSAVTVMPLDTENDDIWFQDLVVKVIYTEAQSL